MIELIDKQKMIAALLELPGVGSNSNAMDVIYRFPTVNREINFENLKSYDQYTIEDMKVFKMDDYQWIAAPSLLHALLVLEEQIGIIEIDDISDIEESNIKTEGLWDGDNVTEQECNNFNNSVNAFDGRHEPKFGELGCFGGEVCRWTSYADVIKRRGVGAYMIACTEY